VVSHCAWAVFDVQFTPEAKACHNFLDKYADDTYLIVGLNFKSTRSDELDAVTL